MYMRLFKRLMDIVLSVILVIISLPMLLLLMVPRILSEDETVNPIAAKGGTSPAAANHYKSSLSVLSRCLIYRG